MNYLLRKYEAMLQGANEAVYVMANHSHEILSIGKLSDERKQKLVKFIEKYPEPGAIYKE